jgi:cyclopropane fatty-acyl-phospholipid synthase-like methyltransferase
VREGRTRTNQLQKKIFEEKKRYISKTETTKWRKTFVLQVQGIQENFEKNKSSVEEKTPKIVA